MGIKENKMDMDYFHVVRRLGAEAVPLLSTLLDINLVNEIGESLLHAAAARNNLQAAKELIRRGININLQDIEGQTPLHYAVAHQNNDLIQYLLINGADLSIQDKYGNTALWTAVHIAHGKYEVIELLMLYGGEQYTRLENKYGKSPLDLAIQIGDNALINKLHTNFGDTNL
jgi:uncharacterized protein